MIRLKIYNNIDKANYHRVYLLSTKFYLSVRKQLLNKYTLVSYNGKGELIDDNV